ncbi:MAG: Type 1 glutamine amidotransferase-like domain-containing protein [Verrucomicrobia bacterium]|nr:Type 1 glutamine amidotransferase-like domain-containing protein [Verrucomicrobiota bacterium]
MDRCLPLRSVTVFISVLLLSAGAGMAQLFDEQYEHWPENLTIHGTIVVGTDLTAETIKPFLQQEAKSALFHGNEAAELMADLQLAIDQAGDRITVVPISAGIAERVADSASLSDVLILLRVDDAAMMERMIEPVRKMIARGGVVVCDGSPAVVEMLGAVKPDGEPGLGLFPDCVLASPFFGSEEAKGKLLGVLATHRRNVGVGIAPGTAVVLSGRKLQAVGEEGAVTTLLMANEHLPIRTQSITPQRSLNQLPEEFLVDLTEWRRDAIDRTLPPFPPEVPCVPVVEKGTLIIVGGGDMPGGLMDQFVELAGGKEAARLVFIPCEESEEISGTPGTVSEWQRSGVAHAIFLHTKDRKRADTDEAFLTPLTDATGIWFGGGRQWNLADSYYGTKAHKLMKEVLQRGGVIGGSSAGASIQARYLARATPINNIRIMAPGYERGGLGFLSGVAIDQHFSQRGRQKDMTQLMARHPQLLGIGIDENTALIVKGSCAEIVGTGRVHFYDRRLPVFPDRPDYIALPAGSGYDLAERSVLQGASQ